MREPYPTDLSDTQWKGRDPEGSRLCLRKASSSYGELALASSLLCAEAPRRVEYLVAVPEVALEPLLRD